MKKLLNQLMREETGQDLMEYGLLASLISVCLITAITAVGGNVNTWYQNLSTQVSTTP